MSLPKSTARQPRKWTLAEDQKLRDEVEAQSREGEVKDWCRVAAKLPGRTNKDCRKRWLNSVAGGLKKGQWAKSEDTLLARGVDQFGQRWTLVAEVVGSRSADQCAKRWQQSLDPELDRSEWRESEDQTLIEAVQRLGRHWKDIQQQHFPGRSKNCIKNRYTVIVRRYQNSGITLPEGLGGSEPGTPGNRLSSYSEDDRRTYTESLYDYDDLLTTQTQVSTPGSHHSWLDDDPFNSWSSPESISIAPTVAPTDYAKFPHVPSAHVATTAQPGWGTTSTSMMYPTGYPSQTPPYSSYAALQRSPAGTATQGSSRHARPPTSSPGVHHASPYQNPEAMNMYMRYGMHAEPQYRY